MKKHFPGHFSPTTREIKSMWDTCIFVVDANILLNMYRYSDETRQEFLRLLESIKMRLWLPHRAAEEYFENRLSVIAQQEKTYDETIKAIQNVQGDLKNSRQHPFISDKLLKRLDSLFDDVVKELANNKEVHSKRTASDEIQDSLRVLFEGNVGDPYSEEELASICKDGEIRYANKVPPGYKDNTKTESDAGRVSNHRRFGDLIIWRQLIDKAIAEKKGFVFVIDDKKEDWWTIFKGRTIGPRPELVKEFQEKTKKKFYMYQADRFLDFASKHFKQAVKRESVDEIRDLRQQDMSELRKDRNLRNDILAERQMIEERLRYLQEKRIRLHAIINEKSLELEHLQCSLDCRPADGKFEPAEFERHLEILKGTERLRGELERMQLEFKEAEMECSEVKMVYARNRQMLEKQRITEPGASLDAEISWGLVWPTHGRRK